MSQYDEFALTNNRKIAKCVKDSTLKFCSDEQRKAIEQYRMDIRSALMENVLLKPQMGLWSISCVSHVWNSEDKKFNSKLCNVPQMSNFTYQSAVYEWFQFIKENGKIERKIVYIDEVSWPGNTPCSNN